jgi:hypothetical protein
VIPPFTPNGNLPPGIHTTTWTELHTRFGITAHRLQLLQGLHAALENLRAANCSEIFIDGSFVTAKLEPNDFDACWNPEGVNAKQLDPVLLDFSRKRAVMKAKYGGELFLMTLPATLEGKPFVTFFQEDRQGNPKGIIRMDLLEWRST